MAALQGRDARGVDVEADDVAALGEFHREGEADVAEADDGEGHGEGAFVGRASLATDGHGCEWS